MAGFTKKVALNCIYAGVVWFQVWSQWWVANVSNVNNSEAAL